LRLASNYDAMTTWPNTWLSCKIEYFIQTTSAYLPGRSAFFTDDSNATPSGSFASNQVSAASSFAKP
jgi:hypothetical protein